MNLLILLPYSGLDIDECSRRVLEIIKKNRFKLKTYVKKLQINSLLHGLVKHIYYLENREKIIEILYKTEKKMENCIQNHHIFSLKQHAAVRIFCLLKNFFNNKKIIFYIFLYA